VVIWRTRVDLPAPFGPKIANISPGSVVRLMSRLAHVPFLYRLLTFSATTGGQSTSIERCGEAWKNFKANWSYARPGCWFFGPVPSLGTLESGHSKSV
jgi:hypothetical protein